MEENEILSLPLGGGSGKRAAKKVQEREDIFSIEGHLQRLHRGDSERARGTMAAKTCPHFERLPFAKIVPEERSPEDDQLLLQLRVDR